MSTSGNRTIATKKTAHTAVSPPAQSLVPPPASPVNPPVFAPFPYTARSQTADKTSERLKVDGSPVLVKGSVMSVDPPANAPALPSGDIVTAAHVKKARVKDGSSRTTSGGEPVAITGSPVAMNVPTGNEEVAQVTAPFVEGGGANAGGASEGGSEGTDKNKKSAVPARGSKKCTKAGHPVDVATGFVVDEGIDLALPGAIPFEWRRKYTSAAAAEPATALGKGGWFHSFDQWVEPMEGGYRYETGQALQIALFKGADGRYFHRGERLFLTEDRRGEVLIHGLADRLTRVFAKVRRQDRLHLVAVRDEWGNALRLEYTEGALSRILDTAGREIRVLSDDRRRVTRLEVWGDATSGDRSRADDRGKPLLWLDYAYHPEGELARVTNALGHADSFEYDGFHRMVKTTLKNGVSFHYEYDERGRCRRTWGDVDPRLFGEGMARLPLHKVELEYRPGGVVTTSGTREPRRYFTNPKGLVVREEIFGGDFAIAREYDEDEYLLSETNAAGETNRFEYDARGTLVRHVDPAGNETRWEVVDDLLRRRASAGPEGPLFTEFHYSGRGVPSSVRFPTGAAVHVRHDGAGRVTEIAGPEGPLVTHEHDAQHNLVAEKNPRGAVTRYRYDPLGRPVERVDALGRTTRVSYDVLGRPVEVQHPDGTVTRSTYDPLGLLASATDAQGRTTRLEYAGTGVLVRVLPPDGRAYRFSYDEDERLRRVENPRAEYYSFDHDWAGRVVRERTFDARYIEYQYNKASRLVRIHYSKDDWRAFSYDPLGNVIEDRCPDGGTVLERDPQGRLRRAVVEDWNNTDIVTEVAYDRFGRVLSEKQGAGEVTFEYDQLSRRTARTVRVDGLAPRTTRYAYAPDGLLIGLDHQGQRLAMEHDPLGREVRRHVYGSGVDIQSRYDLFDSLAEQRVTAPGPADGGQGAAGSGGAGGAGAGGERASAGAAFQELVRRKWHYDAAGRPVSIEDRRWGTTTYAYDKIGNLVEARRGHHLEVFDYDVTGSLQNILDRAGGPPTPSWHLREGNRLTRTATARFRDDDRGRRIQKIDFAGGGDPGPHGKPRPGNQVTLYGWDARDRLREVVLPDGSKVRFWYDAFGRRVKKEVFGAELSDFKALALLALEKGPEAVPGPRVIDFVWDGNVLAAEVERGRSGAADEAWSRFHVHEPGGFTPMLQEEVGAVFVVVNDHLGMPKELVDPAGRVAWSAAHSAWGRVLDVRRDPVSESRWGEVESPFRLLGQYEDAETGLRYTRFRYFDAEHGRWMSPDPLRVFGGMNLLAFGGAPTCSVDLFGLACEPRRHITDGVYTAEDREDPRFFANAGLDDGILSFNYRLKITIKIDGEEVTLHSQNLRGAEEFQAAVQHFGARVKALKGDWQFGDNLEKFNKLTKKGLSPSEAALGTWTGGQARIAGFNRAVVEPLQGPPGEHPSVLVHFYRE